MDSLGKLDVQYDIPSYHGDSLFTKSSTHQNELVQMIKKFEFDLEEVRFGLEPIKCNIYEKLKPKDIGTFKIVHDKECSIELDSLPSELQDIPVLNRKLEEKEYELKESQISQVDYNKPPYGFCYALPLYVANKKGCKIDKIDFLLSSSILKKLFERECQDDRSIVVQLRNGVLVLRMVHSASHSGNSMGQQFKNLVTEGANSPLSHPDPDSSVFNLREISVGNFRLLVNGCIDAINYGSITDIHMGHFMHQTTFRKQNNSKEPWYVIQAKVACIRMLETGAEYLLQPERKYYDKRKFKSLKHDKCMIQKINKYRLEEVLEKATDLSFAHGNQETIDDVFWRINEVLVTLKNNVQNGTITSESNCFYKLIFRNPSEKEAFNDWMVIEKMQETEIKDTVEYCSQELYDIVSNTGPQDNFINKMKELNRKNFETDPAPTPKLHNDIGNENKYRRPRLKLLPRSVKTALNEMADVSRRESIFGKAKPINIV